MDWCIWLVMELIIYMLRLKVNEVKVINMSGIGIFICILILNRCV